MGNLLITFDYELFLGTNSGTPQKCMIEPTNAILNVLDTHACKAVFFVDTTYLYQLKKIIEKYPKALADYNDIVNQLRVLVKKGHYIFPHLHPHWLDAVYNPVNNEWSLNNSRYYCFSSLDVAQQNILFQESMEIIRSITDCVSDEYLIDGYRAGGWSIQPFPLFMQQFLKHGIVHEFSVRKEMYMKSDAQCYDFRNAPDKDIYRFHDNVVKEDVSGGFLQYTISAITLNKHQNWLSSKIDSLIYRLKIKNYGDGRGIATNVIESENRAEKNGGKQIMASIEEMNFVTYLGLKKAMKNREYFHFISHPKMVTPLQLKLFARLLKKAGRKETDFRRFLSTSCSVERPKVSVKRA
ncbi:hypothetical protein QEG73_08395 [Chitinophagaceae bacterium 26-R-25]|nr:hypothetical protein [Chitinophagaceae bacterium 26-R-25]